MFIEHPSLTMGFTPDFLMRTAGAVEFALAFSLMWTPLVRRVGAIILSAMFISAMCTFGKMDLLGHTMIIVVLLAIVGDARPRASVLKDQWLIPLAYVAAVATFLIGYYEIHSVLFGTSLA